jgi:hypothetical protein
VNLGIDAKKSDQTYAAPSSYPQEPAEGAHRRVRAGDKARPHSMPVQTSSDSTMPQPKVKEGFMVSTSHRYT